jgi:hypothetical protein
MRTSRPSTLGDSIGAGRRESATIFDHPTVDAVRGRLALALLLATVASCGHAAQTDARDPDRPKCTFHVFTDAKEVWPLTPGPSKRRWLLMNVGNSSVLLTGSETTSPEHPAHEELVLPTASTIATMAYGQPTVRLASAGDQTTVVVCRYFGRE